MRYALALLLGAAIAVGCVVKTERVYIYPDGSQSTVPIERNVLDLRLANVASGEEAYSLKGTWTGSGKWVSATMPQVLITSMDPGGAPRTCTQTPEGAVTGLPLAQEGATSFAVRSEAGQLSFDGTIQNRSGQGAFTLKLDPAYCKQISELTGASLDGTQLLELFLRPIPSAYIVEVKKELGAVSLADARKLRNASVNGAYISAMKSAGLDVSADDLVSLRNHGIRAEYVRDMAASGLKITVPDVMDLSRHGIQPGFVKGMYEAGYAFKKDEILELSRHGIRSDFAKAWKQAGYKFGVPELIEASRYGLRPEYAKTMRDAGYEWTLKDLIELNRYGIRTDYAAAAQKSGYQLSLSDLVELNRYGISTDFLAALHEEGKPNYAVADIVEFNRKGLSADTIRRIRSK